MIATAIDGAELDRAKLEAFKRKTGGDMGALTSAPSSIIGRYRAMAGAAPLASQEVAERSGAAELYVGHWLANQAASAPVSYNADATTSTLPGEHGLAPAAVTLNRR